MDMDMYGIIKPTYDVTGMFSPVLCRHCGEAYDLTTVKVVVHGVDTSTFITPCCGKKVDDRVSFPAFRRLQADEIA